MKFLSATILILLTATTFSLAQETTPEVVLPTFTLTIWLPDALTYDNNADVLALFNEQAQAFTDIENIPVEIRVKKLADVGGIMSTLKSATTVAPLALPTLTLLPRQELLLATQENLIYPLELNMSAPIITPLGNRVALGEIDNVLYGIPYLLDVLHLIYRSEDDAESLVWSYESILTRNQPFLFPANRKNNISSVFLAQYIASGGSIGLDGSLELNEEALLEVLSFYESASDARLIDGFAVNYANPLDYLPEFLQGDISQVIISSTAYLRLRSTNTDILPAPIPTINGETITILDGWNWVMVSPNPDEQNIAMRFIAYMMDEDRARELATILEMLPSQPALLSEVVSPLADEIFYEALLANTLVTPHNPRSLTLERTMQDALISVLTKERTANQATQYVLEQVVN